MKSKLRDAKREDAVEVFRLLWRMYRMRRAERYLDKALRWMPDGEHGERLAWAIMQYNGWAMTRDFNLSWREMADDGVTVESGR